MKPHDPQHHGGDAAVEMTGPIISMVAHAAATETHDVNADTSVAAIKRGRWERPIEQIRSVLIRILFRTGDRKAAKQAVDGPKKKLPGILWSGRFSRRATDALIQHSGLLCGDLDQLGSSKLRDVRAKLLQSEHLYALFRSPTGDGLKAVFRVSADASKHLASFWAVELHVRELTGIRIDGACKDLARICFVSSDPDIYSNPSAREIAPVPEPQKPQRVHAPDRSTSDVAARRCIAVELLGEIQWDSETHGFCTCPGKHLHTTGDAERDCKIHLDDVPTIHCFHNSCADIRDELNCRLRSRISTSESGSQLKSTQHGPNGQLRLTPSKWFSKRYPLLADDYGDAVLEKTDKNGKVSVWDVGEDFLAATLGEQGSPDWPTIFLPTEEKFYTYAPNEGIFVHQRDPALLAQLSRLLLRCARVCQHDCDTSLLKFRFRDSATLCGVLRKARGLLAGSADYFSTDLADFIPCSNGMLRLKDKELLPFSPSYHRRNKLAVPFDLSATCPVFLDTLMRQALDDDELDLVQRWCGLALIGENLAQRILILIGTAGGGKGTFIRVLNGVKRGGRSRARVKNIGPLHSQKS